MKCKECAGSGQIMGLGFTKEIHSLCKGTGILQDECAELRQKYPELTEQQAHDVLAEAKEEVAREDVAYKQRLSASTKKRLMSQQT